MCRVSAARIDDAERAQRQRRHRLHLLARLGPVFRRQADQPLDQQADQRNHGGARVLLGWPPAITARMRASSSAAGAQAGGVHMRSKRSVAWPWV